MSTLIPSKLHDHEIDIFCKIKISVTSLRLFGRPGQPWNPGPFGKSGIFGELFADL